MINTNNINEARKQIEKLKKENKPVIIKAQDPEFNRKIVENKDVDIILGLEFHTRKDSMKQRDSGLNEVLAKLAKENDIAIGIDINELKKLPKKEKARVIARIKQNIFLYKKAGCKIMMFPKEYKKHDAMSFLQVLGSDTKMARNATE